MQQCKHKQACAQKRLRTLEAKHSKLSIVHTATDTIKGLCFGDEIGKTPPLLSEKGSELNYAPDEEKT